MGFTSTIAMEAGPVYSFSITVPVSITAPLGFSASGDLSTTGSSSPYTISSISGFLSNYISTSAGGATITGGAITGVSTYDGATNVIPPASTGFSFADANGDNYNVHLLFGSTYVLSDQSGNLNETATVNLALVALPEATTMALSGLGLLAVLFGMRRRRSAIAQ
jgi:hypothetical protein